MLLHGPTCQIPLAAIEPWIQSSQTWIDCLVSNVYSCKTQECLLLFTAELKHLLENGRLGAETPAATR